MIESVNNERIKKYAKLNNKKFRDETGLFIVEGEHLVSEARNAGILVEAFSLDGSIGTKVTESVMKKLSSLKSVPKQIGIAEKGVSDDIYGNVLVLDGIQDPGNLGTIIRSAVAFNIDTIIASSDTVDVYNTKTLRSSEGMFFHINYVVGDLEEIIAKLNDYLILTTDVNAGEDIRNLKLTQKYALIVGNEGNGVRENIATLANKSIYIPMNNMCESLNVAIATSIILYELTQG